MEKKNIDWSNLGFGYVKTDYRFVSDFKDGKWDEGRMTEDDKVVISECAGVLQYAQTVFEGMKAYTTQDGRIVTFRPDLNASRMADSARRLEMPVFPEDRFIQAVVDTVKANAAYVPPYGSGATLYIRPYMFGSNPVIGVKPADEYQFRIFVTPVGPYFKGGVKPLTIRVSDFDRAAPHGTGHIKAGLNYAMSLHAIMDAHNQGFDENMYLDAGTRTKVEETGGANFLFITKEGKVVTPKSNSILPSITRRSLMYVAKEYLGLEVKEREVYLEEVKDFAECGLCGVESAGFERNETKMEAAIRLDVMLHAYMLTQSGIPMLYSGDEIAQVNDYTYKENPLKQEDSRYIHRGAFHWELAKNRNDISTVEGKVFQGLTKLERLRKTEAVFDSSASVYTYDVHDNGILCIMREKAGEKFFGIFNFSSKDRTAWMQEEGNYKNLISGETVELKDVFIPAHGFIWAKRI